MNMKEDENSEKPLLETLPQVKKYKPRPPTPTGRKPGSKNKLTLLREAVLNKQEEVILNELPKIVAVVCKKAAEGDLTAAKLILERIIPVRKQSDEEGGPKGPPTINITVSGTTTKVEVVQPPSVLDIDEADFQEIDEDSEDGNN
jgi:hypothetical protein